MNSTQNKKIDQVKETTMIVGIDVGSEKHYFRAFNWRGIYFLIVALISIAIGFIFSVLVQHL